MAAKVDEEGLTKRDRHMIARGRKQLAESLLPIIDRENLNTGWAWVNGCLMNTKGEARLGPNQAFYSLQDLYRLTNAINEELAPF